MQNLFNEYVRSIETYIMFQIKQMTLALTPKLNEKNRSPISLDMGAPITPPPEYVINKLKEHLSDTGINTYSTPKGDIYFLDAVAQKMKKMTGVNFDTKTEICSLIGSKEGLANLIRALINPTVIEKDKDIILIPDPGYASVKEMVKVSGGIGYPVPLKAENNYMPNLDNIIEELKAAGYDENKVKALIINYPNNPLGATATIEYFEQLVDFCKKKHILLVSDAAYNEIYFPSAKQPPSIFNVEGAKDIAIEFYSFSKPYAMTGWRLGWVCGNKDAVGMLARLKSTIDTGIFKAVQKAGADVLNSSEGDEYIKQANISFEKNQKILLNGFKELGWDIDNLIIPEATFYLWLPIPPRYKTSKEFTDDVLKTSGVVFVPGNAFGENGEGFFRISVVVGADKLNEVISRLKEDGFYFEK